MTSLRGQRAARAAFEAALASGHLHHGWLLAGPQGIGKSSFAREMGASLVGGGAQRDALIAARSHPDFRLVEREVWDKDRKDRIVPYDQRKDGDAPARSIRIAQIRMLEPVLAVRPSLGDRRVIVIDAADDLERAAANALLKNLEEPPAGTIFLLVSHAPGRLLPTIRSRCRLLRFEALDMADMRAALGDRLPDAPAEEIDALVRAGAGSPGRALRYAGLDLGGIDRVLSVIGKSGDPDNAERARLAKALALKAARPRYEAFLDRVPAFIAEQAPYRAGAALRTALDAYDAARAIAAAARGLSLDEGATVFELAGVVARLAR